MDAFGSIKQTLINGNTEKLNKTVQETLNQGFSPKEILNEGLISGMDMVGENMESGDMFIPEVLRSAHAMSGALEILKPLLAKEDLQAVGKVVIGTVKGDLHDIGKNLVVLILESAGFEVWDLGIDVVPERFVSAIKEKRPHVVALSALLTTTMGAMKETVDMISKRGLRDGVKIIVGGAPVNQCFADEIGADGYAPEASSASKLIKGLLGGHV